MTIVVWGLHMKQISIRLGLLWIAISPAAMLGAQQMDWLNGLRSDNQAEREVAANSIIREHEQLSGSDQRQLVRRIEALVTEFVQTPGRAGSAKTAMLLLGKLKSAPSVPLLVENLTFEVFYKSSKRPQPPEDLYPAATALIMIGEPSVGPILERVRKTDDAAVTRASAAVLRGVLGPELAGTKVVAEMQMVSDTAEKRRLAGLVRAIQQQ